MFVHIFLRENSGQKVADLSTFSASLEEEAVRSSQRDSTAIHSAAARYMRPLAYHSSGNVTSQEYYDVIVATTAHTHTRLTALCPGLPGWAGTRKVKPIWILLKQETVSCSEIRWAICKSAPCSRQITTPAPHRSVFTGRMPFLPPNQQRQSTEGTSTEGT